jgi:integrase
MKLGRFGSELTAEQARTEAKRVRAQVALDRDPAAERRAARRRQRQRQEAPTVAELAGLWQEDRKVKWRPTTARAYRMWIKVHVVPAIGKTKAHEVEPTDVRRLYRSIVAHAPTTANQVLRALSSMYSWGVAHDDLPMIVANPCIAALDRSSKAPEERRERYPANGELGRLVAVLADRDDLPAKFFGLMLLTGCRKGELLGAKWSNFDLDGEHPTWTKPASSTKQRKLHRLPLNTEAVALLRAVKDASPLSPFGKLNEGNLRWHWVNVCKAAGIADLRAHDLRHWHASLAASAGETLLTIGGLLGHRSPQTTHRYSHLLDDSLRAASGRVGQVINLAGRRP